MLNFEHDVFRFRLGCKVEGFMSQICLAVHVDPRPVSHDDDLSTGTME